MSETTKASASGGVSFTTLLTVLFIGLKLTHYIAWSWWWVLAPMWMGAVFAILILLIVLTIVVIAAVVK